MTTQFVKTVKTPIITNVQSFIQNNGWSNINTSVLHDSGRGSKEFTKLLSNIINVNKDFWGKCNIDIMGDEGAITDVVATIVKSAQDPSVPPQSDASKTILRRNNEITAQFKAGRFSATIVVDNRGNIVTYRDSMGHVVQRTYQFNDRGQLYKVSQTYRVKSEPVVNSTVLYVAALDKNGGKVNSVYRADKGDRESILRKTIRSSYDWVSTIPKFFIVIAVIALYQHFG